ncbi:hypothetical protein FACS189434_07550 [Bacteroidia bacterium]|nr:hypothetical protein FACS189434_07550 [Bacteroidia bacterium]
MFGVSETLATAQIPDILIYDKYTLSLQSLPLDIYQPDGEFAQPKNLFNGEGCFFTACWRNYIATWEIIDNKLYLTKIQNACYPTNLEDVVASFKDVTENIGNEYADLKALFPKEYKEGKVFASWVTTKMYAPFGNQLLYIHNGFESVYEYDYEFNIKNGVIEKVIKHHNKQITSSVFSGKWNETDEESYISADTLDKFVKTHIDWERLPTLPKDSVVIVEVFFEADKNGVIKTVTSFDEETPDVFLNEVVRVIKTVPYGSYIVRGEYRGMRGAYAIKFSVPIDSLEEQELAKRDSLIRHYTEEQKLKIIKERENITDSVKVLFYKEFRKEDSRKYDYLYMFIDYTFGNKYLKETLERNKDMLQRFPHILEKKNTFENNKMKQFSSSCWFPLTFYNGSFYNFKRNDDVCIITDTAIYTNDIYIEQPIPITNFEVIDSTHFKITHNYRNDETHTLDIYFHDERFAVFKFSQRQYPQLYVNSEGIKYMPIITYSRWQRDEDMPKALDSVSNARENMPIDGEIFFKSLHFR